jgi:HEPN domain-containing protein
MDREKYITYWIEESDKDAAVMRSLFENEYRTWALFIGHLVLEKLLKAFFLAQIALKK